VITLLYHGTTVGPLCRAIAAQSKGKIEAVSDHNLSYGKEFDVLIRWDSVAAARAKVDLNPVEAVRLAKNKREARLALGDLAPETWTSRWDLRFPCVIRPSRHFAAKKFFVCNNRIEAKQAIRECRPRLWYGSPLIDKEFEYRVFVFDDEPIKVIRRFVDDPKLIAWNFHNGGRTARIRESHWPKAATDAAVAAAKKIGLGWCAVDVIVTKDGHPYVLELNTAPGVTRTRTHKLLANTFAG